MTAAGKRFGARIAWRAAAESVDAEAAISCGATARFG